MATYKENEKIVELVRNLSDDKRYYITSLEFSKIIDKLHRNVLRDIRQEITRLEKDGVDVSSCFTESTYYNAQNALMPSYNITANGILKLTSRYGRYSYKLRYDLIELANWLKAGIMFFDNDYSCFKKKK